MRNRDEIKPMDVRNLVTSSLRRLKYASFCARVAPIVDRFFLVMCQHDRITAGRSLAHYLNRDKVEMCLPIDLFRSGIVRSFQLAQMRGNLPECQWIFQGVDAVVMLVLAIGLG